ncbi:MAG: hypothetical protein P4M00_13470 [Azospirillaceae bacterium]|nr:hypothetical protein [Azospirillaceae bacterium]
MTTDSILIHVRFAPNGAVVEIGERPPTISPQDWFNLLSRQAANHYQTFAGGRGTFRVPHQQLLDLSQPQQGES